MPPRLLQAANARLESPGRKRHPRHLQGEREHPDEFITDGSDAIATRPEEYFPPIPIKNAWTAASIPSPIPDASFSPDSALTASGAMAIPMHTGMGLFPTQTL